MSSRLQPLNLTAFSGGLNMRADAFQLADDESPEMLNVEVDPRGGFYSRRGWERWNEDPIAAAETWDPRHAAMFEMSSGVEHLLVSNQARIHHSSNSAFSVLEAGAADPIVCEASPHLADFAAWGDTLYIACGRTRQTVKWVGSGNATRLTSDAWNDDYLTPGTARAPQAEFLTAHAGYMFAANTRESATNHPNRIRWSHPNVPESWKQSDYIDILAGGSKITGIVSNQDHLLIFKTSSVWALYGYDSNSWQLVNVSQELGAIHRQCIVRAERAVFFVSWPQGVHAIIDGRVSEISEQLRPAFTSTNWNQSKLDHMWLGWLDKRLWWGVPFWEDGTAESARSVFVLDPSLGERGSWTMFRSALEEGLGPFAQGNYVGGSDSAAYGVCRCGPAVVRIGAREDPTDTMTGEAVPFTTSYCTRWLDGGWPTLKKSWRRPDIIAKEETNPYTLGVEVFHDFQEANPKRQRSVFVDGNFGGGIYGTEGLLWGTFEYGAPPKGSLIARTGSLGSARSVQLCIMGEPGKPWGVDAIIFKFVPRRFR